MAMNGSRSFRDLRKQTKHTIVYCHAIVDNLVRRWIEVNRAFVLRHVNVQIFSLHNLSLEQAMVLKLCLTSSNSTLVQKIGNFATLVIKT
jgi:hypothetical protein